MTRKEDTQVQIDLKTMEALEEIEIVEIRGISGKPATVDVAAEAPQLVRVHAMSGNVYDIANFDGEVFSLLAYEVVYSVNDKDEAQPCAA